MGYWNDLFSGKASLRKKVSEDIGELISFLMSDAFLQTAILYREINDSVNGRGRLNPANKYILGYLFSVAMQLYDSLENDQTASTDEDKNSYNKLFTVTCAFSIALNMNRRIIEDYFEHIIMSNDNDFYSGMKDLNQSLSLYSHSRNESKKMISAEFRSILKNKGYD